MPREAPGHLSELIRITHFQQHCFHQVSYHTEAANEKSPAESCTRSAGTLDRVVDIFNSMNTWSNACPVLGPVPGTEA